MKQLVFLFLFTVSLFATSTFYLDMEDTSATVELGNSYVFEGYVHNTSGTGIVVQVTRISEDLPEGWTSSICFATTCYPPYINQATEGVEANDSTFFDITFTALTTQGTGTALVEFMDLVTGEKDSIRFTVTTQTAASFEISVPDTVNEILAGQSHDFSGYVYNIGNKPATVFMVREQNNLPDGWSSQLCFGSCPQSTVDTLNMLIMNGDSLEYKITFYTNDTPEEGSALLAFYVADEQDTIKQAFTLSTTATDISDSEINQVEDFRLFGNYPNPFNPTTAISYQLSAVSQVVLTVYDISGKAVQTLVNGRQGAGTHTVQFDAAALSSGTYFYQLKSNGLIKTGKMLLIK